jgi:ubiquinone/menaquinone biosynthesis C-methylase UbiE
MVDRVFIADSSKGMLSQAIKKKCFIVVQSNSEALPFNDETFPRIIMVDALHHVKDYKASLSEFWRVLMVGGRIVIEEPDIQTTTVKLLAIFEKIILMRSHFLHSHEISEFFNFPDARTIVNRNGSTVWIIIEKLGQIAQ